MRECVVIALAGTDIDDLKKAKFAEIRRQPYVDAATLLTTHNKDFDDMSVNETRAKAEFAVAGGSGDAVLQQAVSVETTEALAF